MRTLICLALALGTLVLGVVVVFGVMINFPSLQYEVIGAIIGAPFALLSFVFFYLGGMTNGSQITLPFWVKMVPYAVVLGLVSFLGVKMYLYL